MSNDRPIGMVLRALEGLGKGPKSASGGWSARCPAHDDQVASLSMSEGEDGRALIRCHAGCSRGSVTQALGLEVQDLFAGTMSPGRETAYTIRDADGRPQAEHVRVDSPDGTKRFFWRLPDGTLGLSGKPVAGLPLYGSERIPNWSKDEPILIVEGEKAADALIAAGFQALSASCRAEGR